jgi:Domain of unknown function (DUF4259)
MGTWGFGPFDSDAAGDMVAGLMKPIRQVVGSKTDDRASDYYCEARAAAQFVMSAHGTDILGGPGLDVVFRALLRMRQDTEWISTWSSPRKLVRSLNDEIIDLFHVMSHCRQCRRAYPSKVFRLRRRSTSSRRTNDARCAVVGSGPRSTRRLSARAGCKSCANRAVSSRV